MAVVVPASVVPRRVCWDREDLGEIVWRELVGSIVVRNRNTDVG